MVDYKFKDKYGFEDLVEIMTLLRAPGGCPWDAEQSHESIKKDFIEETYEVIEAINKKDKVLLCEELGDVLLQVVFHSEISRENGDFAISDVTDGICKKLIERHPHVFANTEVNSTDDVLSNWDTIKRKTKGQKTQGSAMQKIPKELPALMRAQKMQGKAKKAGFDWDNIDGAYESLDSEIKELKEAALSENKDRVKDEFGDVLFSCVNIARFLDIDAEEALSDSSDKFMNRYLKVEAMAKERDIDMKEASIEKLDELWNEAKQSESNKD